MIFKNLNAFDNVKSLLLKILTQILFFSILLFYRRICRRFILLLGMLPTPISEAICCQMATTTSSSCCWIAAPFNKIHTSDRSWRLLEPRETHERSKKITYLLLSDFQNCVKNAAKSDQKSDYWCKSDKMLAKFVNLPYSPPKKP